MSDRRWKIRNTRTGVASWIPNGHWEVVEVEGEHTLEEIVKDLEGRVNEEHAKDDTLSPAFWAGVTATISILDDLIGGAS